MILKPIITHFLDPNKLLLLKNTFLLFISEALIDQVKCDMYFMERFSRFLFIYHTVRWLFIFRHCTRASMVGFKLALNKVVFGSIKFINLFVITTERTLTPTPRRCTLFKQNCKTNKQKKKKREF